MSPRKKTSEDLGVEDIFERPTRKKVSPKRPNVSEVHRKTIVFQSMEHDEHERANAANSHHIALYRNIALGFFVVTMLLFGAIFFTSVRKASISIGYVPQKVNYTDVVQVARQRADGKTIAGVVEVQQVKLSRSYTPTTREQKDVPITGFVQIVNDNTKDQPLVKTTRLLSPDGKLYRLNKSVVVPAHGTLDHVEVYADQPGTGSAVGAGTPFTIPGLWEPLQKKIYAKSEAAFQGGVDEHGVIGTQDMQQAEADVRSALTAQAQEQLHKVQTGGAQGVFDSVQVTLDTLQIERSADIGASVGQFTLTAKANAIIVRYSASEMEQYARAHLSKLPLEAYATLAFDASQLTVRVESYDAARGQAQLSIFEPITKVMWDDAPEFASSAFAGKNEEEIRSMIKNLSGIDSPQVDVSLFPYWVKTVPSVGGTVTVSLRQLPAPEKH